MGVLEKFIDLVKIDSPSDPASPTCPSTAMQLDVANHLERVMKEMGISNVRQQDGYVYGEIPPLRVMRTRPRWALLPTWIPLRSSTASV